MSVPALACLAAAGYLATSMCVALTVGRILAHHDRDDR